MLWCDFGVMFNFGFAKIFPAAVFENISITKTYGWVQLINLD